MKKFIFILISLYSILTSFPSQTQILSEEGDEWIGFARQGASAYSNSDDDDPAPRIQLSIYGRSIYSQSVALRCCKVMVAGYMGVASSTWLLFLSRDLFTDLTGMPPIGYLGGIVSQIPSAYILYKSVYDKESDIIRSVSPSWKLVQSKNFRKSKRLAFICKEFCMYPFGIMLASVGSYYTHYYLAPILGWGSLALTVPTFIAQTELGVNYLKLFGKSLFETIDTYLLARCWGEQKQKRVFVKHCLRELAISAKSLSKQDVRKMEAHIRNENLYAILEPTETKHNRCVQFSRTLFGLVGSVIGITGTYAIISVADISINYFLTAAGFPTTIADPSSEVLSYMAAIAVSSFKAQGSLKTFSGVFNYLIGAKTKKAQKLTDGISALLGLVSTSSRVKLVLDADIKNPFLRYLVIVCNITGTAAVEFFGFKGLQDLLIHGRGPQQKLSRFLSRLADEVDSMRDDIVNSLYIHLTAPMELTETSPAEKQTYSSTLPQENPLD